MYQGFLVKMDNKEVPPFIIEPGTYQFTDEQVIAGSWRDANGNMHYSYYPNNKAHISFTIKKRTQAQQSSIASFFSKNDNIAVEYWDDKAAEYKTAVCKMKNVTFKHQYDDEFNMYYDSTDIDLMEY